MTLDLRWGTDRILFPPSGPVTLELEDELGTDLTAHTWEMWIQPRHFAAEAPQGDRLISFSPSPSGNNILMSTNDISAVNRRDARWVLTMDGVSGAGGYCTGTIEGTKHRNSAIPLVLGHAIIRLSLPNLSTLTAIDGGNA